MIITERGKCYFVEDDRGVHATFSWENFGSSRNIAKIKAEAWVMGYRYALLTPAPNAPMLPEKEHVR